MAKNGQRKPRNTRPRRQRAPQRTKFVAAKSETTTVAGGTRRVETGKVLLTSIVMPAVAGVSQITYVNSQVLSDKRIGRLLSLYEFWKPTRLRLRYTPNVPVTVGGRVFTYWEHDANTIPEAQTPETMSDQSSATSFPVASEHSWNVRLVNRAQPYPTMINGLEELRMSTPGYLNVVVDILATIAAGTILGHVWLDFTFDLMEPNLPPHGLIVTDHVKSNNATDRDTTGTLDTDESDIVFNSGRTSEPGTTYVAEVDWSSAGAISQLIPSSGGRILPKGSILRWAAASKIWNDTADTLASITAATTLLGSFIAPNGGPVNLYSYAASDLWLKRILRTSN